MTFARLSPIAFEHAVASRFLRDLGLYSQELYRVIDYLETEVGHFASVSVIETEELKALQPLIQEAKRRLGVVER